MATTIFAAQSGSARSPAAMAEMNITPLVDVMLVLLVIFMVAAPMLTGSIDMTLPQNPRTQVEPPRHINLDVAAVGSYRLDGAVMSKRGLQSALAQLAHDAPNSVIEVGASEDADYQSFTSALSALRQNGLRNVALKQ